MKYVLITLALFFLLFQCRRLNEPFLLNPADTSDHSLHQGTISHDTADVRVEVQPGVWLTVRWESNDSIITFDGVLSGEVTLKNDSADTPFHLHIVSWPPEAKLTVTDENDSLLYYYPVLTGRAILDKYLFPGDSVTDNIVWNQAEEVRPGSQYIKVYSGVYHLYATIRGYPDSTNKRIHRRVTILPVGNRFNTRLFYIKKDSDSTAYRFVIRNRIPEAVDLVPVQPNPLELQYRKESSDSIFFVQYFLLNETSIHLSPHSEWNFSFKLPSPGHRLYDFTMIKMILHTQQGDFSSEYFWI